MSRFVGMIVLLCSLVDCIILTTALLLFLDRYLVFSNTLPVKQAATLGARLVRKLLLEKAAFFLASPLSWKD